MVCNRLSNPGRTQIRISNIYDSYTPATVFNIPVAKMIPIRVKYGKDVHDLQVDTTAPVAVFKAQLEQLTGVPSNRQKIMGVKGGQLKDDAVLADVGLSSAKPLMLIGSADGVPEKPSTDQVFAEDAKASGHTKTEIMSNGLVNLGNTCYMNSSVQALRMIPEFRSRLNASTHPLAKALGSLYNHLDTTRQPLPPALFWTALMGSYPQFARTSDRGFPMQHDAQETLSCILEVSGDLQAEDSLFRGTTVDATGADEEPFSMLRCHISQEVTILEAGIERSLGDRKISHLPPYIIVHLARFAWRQDTNENAKVLRPVTFPMVMDLQPFCTAELKAKLEPARVNIKQRRETEMQRQRNPTETAEVVADAGQDPVSGYYELAAAVSHKGRTLDGGHYIAWAKKQGAWLVFDDDNVARVTEDDVGRLRGVGEAHIAYVLVFRCRDPESGKCQLP
jgi:ubiquitin carboxyl-terminal hydrolase 14